MKNLYNSYTLKQKEIHERLDNFKNLKEKDYLEELIFCILTPQSNAKKCAIAAEEIIKLKQKNESNIKTILKSRTRFHNNKTKYVIEALSKWKDIQKLINSNKIPQQMREELIISVKGFGLKESSHFLRNIGKSNNKIAILDRHILKNLRALNIIKQDKIKSKKDYLEKEQQFIKFSKSINIPIDELDLLFWSNETGEIFK